MKKEKRFCLKLLAVSVLLGVFCLAAGNAPVSAQETKAVLTASDCVKCHEKEPAAIEAKGSAHKTAINCQDCHAGHRPKVAKNIPQCSNCHEGEPHFKVEGCLTCHNPHQPLEIVLKGEQKAVCLTCHDSQGKELVANPSKHTEVACNFCHANKHGVIPECVQCHDPHSKNMTKADCKTCHQAHQPLTLNYPAETASAHCAACHDTAFNQLMASKTKHKELACAFCHQNKHKTIPNCSDCHGTPHAAGMHQKFPKCGDCHNIAHDLNNWGGQKEQQKAPAPKAPAPKAPPAKAPAQKGSKG